jgi:pimeloyl-ACP methyl ester carboxylesterase
MGATELAEVRVRTSSALNREVIFAYRRPALAANDVPRAVLVLVPGMNGDGKAWLRGENAWTRFADAEGLVLVGPSFCTTPEEVRAEAGYYYPRLWSGEATMAAVEKIGRQERVPVDKLLIFGFSAGAHFAHRFALWKPQRVGAFVAYSAAWWDKPTAAAHGVPGLLLCGEEDPRFGPTRACVEAAQRLGLPWMWRGYREVSHEVRPPVVLMAQVFLRHYARADKTAGPSPFIGDAQTYAYFAAASEEASRIPEELRVCLPSREIAEIWKEEN